MRAKNVFECPVGALSFYLLCRFHVSGEMSPPPDFTKNSSWFGIKLLTDGAQQNSFKSIKPSTHASHAREVLMELKMSCNSLLHLGRTLGPRWLELLEQETKDTQNLGNWNPDTQQKHYSTKLPMKVLRSMAGFVSADGMHFNPRTVVEPPADLVEQMFPWLASAEETVSVFESRCVRNNLPTAKAFLSVIRKSATIALQDAASMKHYEPERFSRCLLFAMPVFRADGFAQFCEEMATALTSVVDPVDTNLEAALPGVKEHLGNLTSEMNSLKEHMRQQSLSPTSVRDIVREEVVNGNDQPREVLSRNLCAAAEAISPRKRSLPETADGVEESPPRLVLESSNVQQFKEISMDCRNNTTKTVSTIYNEYHGIGEFEGRIGIAGGLAAVDAKFGRKWRTSNGQDKAFSRVKQIVNAVEERVSEEKPVSSVLTELDGSLPSEPICLLSKLHDLLRKNGVLPPPTKRRKKTEKENLDASNQ